MEDKEAYEARINKAIEDWDKKNKKSKKKGKR